MPAYRISYGNIKTGISSRRRIALDLKSVYWKDREIPKDWYWFENKIELVELAPRGGDCVEVIIADDLVNIWTPSLLFDLVKTNTDIQSIEYKKGDSDHVTLFSR